MLLVPIAAVDHNGIVCAVANTGASPTGAQWLGSRVISAQKANCWAASA